MKSVGILLFIVGIGNFVYQGILTLRKLRKEANEVRTTHRFCCTACGEKNFQERLYDLNITKLKGRIRYQGTEFQLRELVLFFLKGVLPLLLVRYLLRFLI